MLYVTIPRERTTVHVKPGYSGDGQTCEGEFVRAQKTLQDIHDDQPKNISEGL